MGEKKDVEVAGSRARCVGHPSGCPSAVRKARANPKQRTVMSRSTFHAYHCGFRVVLEGGHFLGEVMLYRIS